MAWALSWPTDVLHALLEVMGAALGGSTRIDFVLEGEDTVSPKPRLVGKVMGIGTFGASLTTI